MQTMSVAERVNKRRIIGGDDDGLMCISPLKHKWARDFWKQMQKNNWFPHEADLSRDVPQYKTVLTDAERRGYDRALAFLSNLDGIQFNNLMFNIGNYITSPEVKMCISRQAYEEANHVDSYATLIEAVSADPQEIYMTYERDPQLAEKNALILAQSQILRDDYTPRNFALAVVANVVLEGIYFYSGFLMFYTLARGGKMQGSADMIRFIQRDEEVHMNFFLKIFETLKIENPEIFHDPAFYADCIALIKNAVALETMWGKHIISGGILGLSDAIIEQYVQWLANDRAVRLGMSPIYPGITNPVPWVIEFSQPNRQEVNFFEGKVSDYQVAGSLEW